MRFGSVVALGSAAAAYAFAPPAAAQDSDALLGVAVLVADDGLDDPALHDRVVTELCDRLPSSGFVCAPQEDVAEYLEPDARPGPDVLERLAEELGLPYAVAVVLYPGAEPGQIDADVFLQVRGRATGIFRGATDAAEEAAETTAETARQMLIDAASRSFGRGAASADDLGDRGDIATGPPGDDGLIDLAISETLQGILVAYLACASFDIHDWRIIGPSLLMGGGTGIAGALLADYYLPIDMAEAAAVAGGGWWGVLEGGLLAKTLGAATMKELAPWSLLGWGLGLGTGITLAATTHLTKGDVALTNSAAAWGTFAGAVVSGTILGRDVFTTSTDYDFALPFAGLNAGLVAGVVTSIWVDVSRGRMALIDLSGLLGVLLGGSVGTPLIFENPDANDKRWYSAIMLVSAAAGITLGAVLTRNMDDDDGIAAASMIEVDPQGDVSLRVPVPRPWLDPTPSLADSRAAPRLGLWVGLAQGAW